MFFVLLLYMPQISWEKAKNKNPEAFAKMFREMDATDDENFKKAYKASTKAQRKVIDEILEESNLHLIISNGRMSVIEEIPQTIQQPNQPQQDVLVSQVIQEEMRRQNLFEIGKPLTKAFFNKAYQVISKVLSMFFSASASVASGVGSYLARHSPAEFGKAFMYVTFSVLMFQAYYAVVHAVQFAGVKIGEGVDKVTEGAQYTSDFVKAIFVTQPEQLQITKEEEKKDDGVPRIAHEKAEDKVPRIGHESAREEKEKDNVKPQVQMPKITNPFVEPAKITSDSLIKSAESVANSFIIVGGLTVFSLVALGIAKQYFAHKRYELETRGSPKIEKRDGVQVEEPKFHPEVQRPVKAVKVKHRPVASQRNLSQDDFDTAKLIAESIRLQNELRGIV